MVLLSATSPIQALTALGRMICISDGSIGLIQTTRVEPFESTSLTNQSIRTSINEACSGSSFYFLFWLLLFHQGLLSGVHGSVYTFTKHPRHIPFNLTYQGQTCRELLYEVELNILI